MPEEKFNYEADLEIDQDSLDREWLRQPHLFMKYSELSAEAKHKMDKAAERVKTIRSQLILQATEGGEELIGVKVNMQTVEAWYRTQDDYKMAKQEFNSAEYTYNILQGAVFAFQQRKTALERLVELWRGGYFSSPKERPSEDGKSIVDQAQDRQRKRLSRNRE